MFRGSDAGSGQSQTSKGPLRLGAPSTFFALPLLARLGEQPGVELAYGTPASLLNDVRDSVLDAALLPPLDCVRVPYGKIIPGVGIVANGPARTERIYRPEDHDPRAPVRLLAAPEEASGYVDAARVALAMASGELPDCCPIREGQPPPSEADALLVTGALAEPGLEGWTCAADVGSTWHAQTQLPLVLSMWVGRLGVVVSRLRHVTARASQEGAGQLSSIAEAWLEGGEPQVAEHLLHGLAYVAASEAMDSVHMLLAQAKAYGLAGDSAAVRLC